MGVRRPEGHIADHRNKRMEVTSRRPRRMEASSKRSQGPEGAVAPLMEWNRKICSFHNLHISDL